MRTGYRRKRARRAAAHRQHGNRHRFVWPRVKEGAIALTPAQLAMLIGTVALTGLSG